MFFFNNSSRAEYEKVFFDHKIKSISGKEIDLKDFNNKVILLVNTASYCGFTKQYSDLQNLWSEYKSVRKARGS